MDKLRDLILDLTKNNIAKKKELLATSDDIKNQQRIKDLDQIQSLEVDPSILHSLQDSSLDRFKEMRDIDPLEQVKKIDYIDPEGRQKYKLIQKLAGMQRIDRAIKDKNQIIGSPDDYIGNQRPDKDDFNSRITLLGLHYPPKALPNAKYDINRDPTDYINEPDVGTYSESDIQDMIQKSGTKLQKLTKMLQGK